jgi:hypothetical protein
MSFKVSQRKQTKGQAEGGSRTPQPSLASARPFAVQPPTPRHAPATGRPETTARVAQAARYGHNFGRVGVRRSNSAPVALPGGEKGLPARLKAGIERLSGMAMGDVRVRYNSGAPARVEAVAHTQGRHIHLGAGQERHLAHEAWHVVQQKQGRVRATTQLKGVGVNDDSALEREADLMGAKALRQAPRASVAVASDTSAITGVASSQVRPSNAGRTARVGHTGVGGAAGASRTPAVQRVEGVGKKRKSRTSIKQTPVGDSKQKRLKAVTDRRSASREEALNVRRGRYTIGQHGAKKSEQKRLGNEFGISVTGDTHESEHTIGFEPLNQTSGLKRGTAGRARTLENTAPAYQEFKPLHRDHIGTGTSNTADDSGFNSGTYRHDQRSLVESGDVGSAVQLNQLGYAFDSRFKDLPKTDEGKAANNSFNKMVENMQGVTYAQDDKDVTVPVDAKQRAEMHLSRIAAQTGKFPSRDEENEARKKFGLSELT